MPPRRSPISRRQARDYHHLSETLTDMQIELRARPAGTSFGGIEAVLARRFMADVARLMAREPGGRALFRLPPTGEITPQIMAAALTDVRVALAAFAQAHCLDGDLDQFWIEGAEQDFAEDAP